MKNFLVKIRFSQLAKNDFDSSILYYKQQSIELSIKFKTDINQSIKRIISFPTLYPKINQRVQKCVVSKFPYTIIYTIKDDIIYILAIASHHRNPQEYENRINEFN